MERWQDIVGYEGIYQISSLGRVKRTGAARGATPGRIRKLTEHEQGYLAVILHRQREKRPFLVHRLVAEAFVGHIGKGQEVNHLDGNKRNNRSSNLEIVTRQENIDHAVSIGLVNNKGVDNPQSKLTEEDVRHIRREYTFGGYRNGGKGYKALAKEYDVSWEAIRNIIKRGAWGEIE